MTIYATPGVASRKQPARKDKTMKPEVEEPASTKARKPKALKTTEKNPQANTAAKITKKTLANKSAVKKAPTKTDSKKQPGTKSKEYALADAAKYASSPTVYSDFTYHEKLLYYPPDPDCPSHTQSSSAGKTAPADKESKMGGTKAERAKRTPPATISYSDTDEEAGIQKKEKDAKKGTRKANGRVGREGGRIEKTKKKGKDAKGKIKG